MSNVIQLELNHCERCGGLVLRRSGSTTPHCNPCARAVQHLPALPARVASSAGVKTGVLLRFRPASERSGARPPSRIVPEIQACCALPEQLEQGDLA